MDKGNKPKHPFLLAGNPDIFNRAKGTAKKTNTMRKLLKPENLYCKKTCTFSNIVKIFDLPEVV